MPFTFRGSRFSGVTASSPQVFEVEWPDGFPASIEVPTKEAVDLFSPAVYRAGKGREKRNTEANIAQVTAIVLDYDDKHEVTVETACAAWRGYDHLVYSTFRHTAHVPRFRIIVPFQRPVSTEHYSRLRVWLRSFLGGAGASTDLLPVGQVYYLPSRPIGANAFVWRHASGDLFDPLEFVESIVDEPASLVQDTPVPVAGTLLRVIRSAPATATGRYAGIHKAHEVADLDHIEKHCAFMARAHTEAAKLPEPEWHSWLSVVARCRGGSQLAHAIGSAHPGYSELETEDKLRRVLDETAPHTCAAIAERSTSCTGCPLKGSIASPISIHYLMAHPTAEALSTDELSQRIATRNAAEMQIEAEIEAADQQLNIARHRLAELQLREAARKKLSKGTTKLAEAAEGIDAEELTYRAELSKAKEEVKAAERTVKRAKARSAGWQDRPAADPDVLRKLQVDSFMNPRSNSNNMLTILRDDPVYRGKFRFNAFSNRVYCGDAQLQDSHIVKYLADIEQRYAIPQCDFRTFDRVAELVAYENEFHPVRDYLEDLKWDQLNRLDQLMERGLGAVVTDDQTAEYLVDVGHKLCISCVARIFAPQEKNEVVVVLVGKQGKGKSSALEALAVKPEWFSDTHLPLGSKDAFDQLEGVWIFEISELDSFRRAENSLMKAFVSSKSDNYRKAYKAHATRQWRQTVFVGSTNEQHFIDDPTGSRRYAPVHIDQADLTWLRANIHQIWAESVVRFRNGERWWYQDQSATRLRTASVAFQQWDPWYPSVLSHLLKDGEMRFVTIEDLLTNAVGLIPSQLDKRASNRMSGIMKQFTIPYDRLTQAEADRRRTGRLRGYRITPELRERLRKDLVVDDDNVVHMPGMSQE